MKLRQIALWSTLLLASAACSNDDSNIGSFSGQELNSSYKCNGIHINNLFKFFVWCEVSKSFTRSII